MENVKVVFMGTPNFSVPILEMLIENYNVVGVVTQPDKLVGRKKILTPSPVKEIAKKNNITVITPKSIKTEYEEILNMDPDLIVTCAFGQLVPSVVLNYPKYGCINVHASLLPKYRGGAPIQRAIMNGEEKTGITIMYMNEGLDTGDIIEKEEVIIDDYDDYNSLSEKLTLCGRELLKRVLPKIILGDITRIVQDDDQAIYAPIIKREDEKLDFNTRTIDLYNKIRALSPEPATYFMMDGKNVKVYSSRIGKIKSNNGKPGVIQNLYEDGLGISTIDGEIIITDIKLEGKNRIDVKTFLNGKNKTELLNKELN